MESPLEDGFHLAVPDHVLGLLNSFLFRRDDNLRVHATHKRLQLEYGSQCE